MVHRRPATALAVAVASLTLPAAAQAATRTVHMGVPPSAQKSLQKYGADVDAFFPKTTTIHVGDSVAFAPSGFHNLDLPKKGGKATALVLPTGKTIAGANDAAAQPFWFNGQPELGFNPALFAGLYGKSVSYDGSKGVQSGLPLGDKLKPVTVKFTKKGSFTYFCDVHPGMKAQVKVLPKTARIPSVKAQSRAVTKQLAGAMKTAKRLDAQKAAKATIDVGRHGADGTELLAFAPATAAVKVGDSLTFRMGAGSWELHTATTGPGNIEDPGSYLGGLAAGFEAPAFPGAAIYPSDPPPAGAAALTPALHGNGFWNSGAMDTAAATPLGREATVRFAQAGTYTFYCLIHPFMKETVTVS